MLAKPLVGSYTDLRAINFASQGAAPHDEEAACGGKSRLLKGFQAGEGAPSSGEAFLRPLIAWRGAIAENLGLLLEPELDPGAIMARAPSYDFERRERQKAKAAKKTEKAKAKTERKAGGADGSLPDVETPHALDSMDDAMKNGQ